jgi:hypothetical protein
MKSFKEMNIQYENIQEAEYDRELEESEKESNLEEMRHLDDEWNEEGR